MIDSAETLRPAGVTVLVTGASGAIGRFVVGELIDRGCDVVAITRQLHPQLPQRPGLAWRQAAIDNVQALSAIIEQTRCSRVAHLAATILNREDDLPGALAANTLGAACVFEAARRNKVERIVHASSKAVFGPLEGEFGHPEFRPVPEDHPRNPQSIYALTKSLAEDVADFYCRRHGMEIVSVRFGTSAGPGKGPQHAGAAVLSRIVENPVRGIPVIISGGGDQRDEIVYTVEVAHGLATICLAPGSLSGVMHLDSGQLVSLRDIADAVRKHIPLASIEVGGGMNYMGYGGIYGRLDGSRARQEAGYVPRFSLDGWVADYIRRVREADLASAAKHKEAP